MSKAFTLVETLIVMALISILIGFGASVSYKATQRQQVDQAGADLQSMLEQARAYSLAGKKIACVNTTLAGWGVLENPTLNGFELVEYCGNVYDPEGAIPNLPTVNKIYPKFSFVFDQVFPIIFRPLGQGVCSPAAGGFSSMASVKISGYGMTKEIRLYPQGRIDTVALIMATPGPTTAPAPTATPGPAPTNTPGPTIPVSTSTPTATPTPSLNSGLLAYWKFDEGGGTAVADSFGTNIGTLVGAPAWSATGKFNSAITFNGSSQYMIADTVQSGAGNAFTVAMWFKTSSTTKGKVYSEGNSTTAAPKVYISINENVVGDVEFGMSDNTGLWGGVATAAIGTNNGAWHQVAIVQQSKSSRQLFLDGVQVAATTTTIGALTLDRTTIATNRAISNSNYFNGAVDDTRIYNRALSPTEVSQLYAYVPTSPTSTPTPTATPAPTATPTPSPTPIPSFNTGMLAYWKLNETSGSPVDSVGTNTGTLVGAPTQNVAGKFNSAVTVNGSSQYMTADTVHSGTGTAFSVVLWFKTSSTTKGKVYYEGNSTVATQGVYISINENVAGDVEFGVYDNAGLWSGVATGAVASNNGAWHQVAIVQQSKSSRQLFLDGVSKGTSAVAQGALTLDRTTIGVKRSTANSNYFNGSVDDIRIYNRALTATEVSQLYSYIPGP